MVGREQQYTCTEIYLMHLKGEVQPINIDKMKTCLLAVLYCLLFFKGENLIYMKDVYPGEFYNGGEVEERHILYDTKENREEEQYLGEPVPDLTIQLASGSNKNLRDFVDNKKYIYITCWPSKQALIIQQLKAYDSIADQYESKLKIIGLLDNGNAKQLSRLIEKYRLKNLNGVIPEGTMQSLPCKGYPYGMLFSVYGRLIKQNMSKDELEHYMSMHITLSKAKF